MEEKYRQWTVCAETELKAELASIANDTKEIEDRFYRALSFGTAGMRGVMGAGSNRMNVHTVRQATRGLAAWLKTKQARGSVAIAFDTRNQSARFALESALTLATEGIKAYLFTLPSPVPLLSYTVRELGCAAGIAVTASHNTKEYNGYKVYDRFGCQMVSEAAAEVADLVRRSSLFDPILSEKEARTAGLLIDLGEEMMEQFCRATMRQGHSLSSEAIADLKIVYTPIHGSGLRPVAFVLKERGFQVDIVAEQAVADGNFPTVKKPNPEEHEALAMGIRRAEETGADLVLGTDPDCDRVGIAVRDGETYHLFNGNQIGALLAQYVLTRRETELKDNAVILKSIVTNDLGAEAARSFGVTVKETLTGFKYIGEAMTAYEKSGEGNFIMGYEESYGFLVGGHARDKDGVVASLLISEMAAYYKEKGQTLRAVLHDLYKRFGFFLDDVDSVTCPGSDGQKRINRIMAALRGTNMLFNGQKVSLVDYKNGIGDLPKADVLKFIFDDGSWIAVRPSGTEPKLKIYYSVKDTNEDRAKSRLTACRQTITDFLNREVE